MHRHSATVCSRIARFSPKCSEKISSASQCKIFISWLNILVRLQNDGALRFLRFFLDHSVAAALLTFCRFSFKHSALFPETATTVFVSWFYSWSYKNINSRSSVVRSHSSSYLITGSWLHSIALSVIHKPTHATLNSDSFGEHLKCVYLLTDSCSAEWQCFFFCALCTDSLTYLHNCN